ncbi:MAG: acylphosphatase [Ignavibacteria bacterium]|nr:acylphosphatase [Ignavibacteria bacterium]
MKVGCKIHVSGIVQGVGFRYFVFKKAGNLSLVGFVKNLTNSNVEIYAEGERSLVEELITRVKIGPPNAHVSGLHITWEEWKGTYSNFKIH